MHLRSAYISVNVISVVLFIFSDNILAQNFTKLLILSPRVGAKITADARKHFGLFPGFENFVEATALESDEGRFYVDVTVEMSGGMYKDTLVEYSYRALLMIAEKINHFEDLQSGKYHMGDEPTYIQVGVSIADSVARDEQHLDSAYTWRNSAYIACGWGFRQDYRIEVGWNSRVMGLGFSFGSGDYWFGRPYEWAIGILGSIRFPIPSLLVSPYLLLGAGTTINLFGVADTYTRVHAGTLIQLIQGIQIRPDLGLDFTSKYISGGGEPGQLFGGGGGPEVKENKTRFGADIIIEIDLANVF